jgi:rhodanese-related sulfurtransferase
MKNNNWFQKLSSYQRAIAVILCVSFLCVGSVSVAAIVNHMDIPTWLGSWNTKEVTVTQLQQGKLKPVILIDVRSPKEYTEDHIGESLLIPLSDIEAGSGVKQIRAIAQVSAKFKQTPPTIVLYCRSGPRSVKAYQRVENPQLNFVVLKGGIKAWRQAVPRLKDLEILAPITLNLRV